MRLADVRVGLDRRYDFRFHRPYLLIPISDCFDAQSAAQRILSHQPSSLTDIVFITHGWHRNLFDALALYDRVMTRLAILVASNTLPMPSPCYPLFVCIHWPLIGHSFGASVATEAALRLKHVNLWLASLCLVNAAVPTDHISKKRIQPTELAEYASAVFSRFDTAMRVYKLCRWKTPIGRAGIPGNHAPIMR